MANHSEYSLHRTVVTHLRLCAEPAVIWFHIPNQSSSSPRTGAFLKAMGVIPGVADLCFIKNGCAMFMEIKSAKGRQSPAQKSFEADCLLAGVPYACVDCIDAAITVLRSWGVIKPMARAA